MANAIELEHTPEAAAEDPRWTAVMLRDARWDGAFFFAVTSTRIYCRPSCPSRRPRADRVKFFSTIAEARNEGFRACKRCRPDEQQGANERFALVLRLVDAIATNQNATLDELAATAGASRSHIQRTFTEVMGSSPLEYATALKAERMRRALSSGRTVSEAAFDAGFESLPQAYVAASRHIGMPPGSFRRGAKGVSVRYRTVSCELGFALVALTDRGVCRVILGDDAEVLEQQLRDEIPHANLAGADGSMSKAIDAVVAAAAGESVTAVPLDLQGTAFQQRVWRVLTRIPAGSTISYSAIANELGSPTAARAVGSACGANPVALLVPCHRVVRSDGALGGYRWGLDRKARLLRQELAVAEPGVRKL